MVGPPSLVEMFVRLIICLGNGALRVNSHDGVQEYHKPWATHGGCAEIVRRFDFTANLSESSFRRFHACVNSRADLPDFHSPGRPSLLAGDHFPVAVVPSKRSPPGYWVVPPWDYVVSNFIRI